MTVGNAVKLGVALGIGVVADNHRNVAGQLSYALAIQQVHQTVIMFGNKNSYPRPIARERDPPLHRKPLRDGRELFGKILQVKLKPVEVPFDSSQIEAFFDRLVLFEIQDVALVPADKVSDRGIQSFTVWTLNQQNGGVSQVLDPQQAVHNIVCIRPCNPEISSSAFARFAHLSTRGNEIFNGSC